jgi:hypothetical protein
MPRGSKPGERRGGRQKGTPNKNSLERAAIVQKKIKDSGQALAIERLEVIAAEFEALAEIYRPGQKGGDETKYVQYLSKAGSILADLAPYQSSKLQSTTLVGDRDKPISHTLNVRFV